MHFRNQHEEFQGAHLSLRQVIIWSLNHPHVEQNCCAKSMEKADLTGPDSFLLLYIWYNVFSRFFSYICEIFKLKKKYVYKIDKVHIMKSM